MQNSNKRKLTPASPLPRKTNRSGHSFPDVLIVVGLIAIVAGTVFGILGPAKLDEMSQVRDLERMEHLNDLTRALTLALTEGEIILTDTSKCDDCDSISGTVSVDGTGWVKFTVPEGRKGLKKYFDSLPLDPLNNNTYFYTFISDKNSQSFKIYVALESPENEVKMRIDGGTSPELYEVGTNLSL